MALIVETGAIVANANSYIDLASARTYAESIGLVLAADDSEAEVTLLNANRFLEGLEPRYQGHRVSAAQALAWPRAQVIIAGFPLPDTTIPNQLKQAQVIAAATIQSGVDLFATQSGQFIKREKVDVIETEYDSEYLATVDGQPIYTAIESMLGLLFVRSGGYRLTQRIGF